MSSEISKEAQEKIARFLEKIQHPRLVYSLFDSRELGLIGLNIKESLLVEALELGKLLRKLGFRKLHNKPPLLSDEEINKAFDEAFDKPIYLDHEPTPEEIITIRLRAVAQTQLNICVNY